MSRRARAIGFGSAALVCAGLAATVARGYRADVEGQLGPLRPVVVARGRVPARKPLAPASAHRLLQVRRIPERFVPPGALVAPGQAVGRVAATPIPPGGYVLAAQLRAPRGHRERRRGPQLGAGRTPVEIAVSGAEALAASGGDVTGSRVDVIVTTEPGPGGGSGRTYIAVKRVRLLALAQPGGGDVGLGDQGADAWEATLALTKSEALRLIQAENFARQVRLIPA